MADIKFEHMFLCETPTGKFLIGEVVSTDPVTIKNPMLFRIEVSQQGVGFALMPYFILTPEQEIVLPSATVIMKNIPKDIFQNYVETVERMTSVIATPTKKLITTANDSK